MPASWTQSFDFYIGMRDGFPVLINLDMAAIEHAPVMRYTVAVMVSIQMKHPNANGLRSDEDFAAMMEAEDLLVPAMKAGVDAIHWGRQVTQGRTHFMFYVDGGALPDGPQRIRQLAEVPGYSPEVTFAQDPSWQHYMNSYPNTYQQHAISNLKLQYQLEQLGDRLSKRRMIDHRALFKSAEAAHQAAGKLKRLKFSVEKVHGPDEAGDFILDFHRKDICAARRPDEVTIEILDTIEPSGGIYDGWGCVTQK